MIKKILLSLFLSFFVLGFLGICFVLAWNEPTSPPPQNNVEAPINVGTTSQVKWAKISATEFGDSNDPFFYVNPNGTSILAGPVAIGGDDTPDFKLESVGSAANGYFGISNTGEGDIFQIDSSGRVGIGITPNTKLDISGAATGADTIVNITNTAFDPYLGFFQGLAPNMGGGHLAAFTFGKQASNNNRAYMGYYHIADGSGSNRIDFGYYGAECLLSIQANGNVGIGDNNLDEKLEVAGGIKLSSALNANDGTIQWTGADFEGRKAGAWVSLTGTGGTPVGPGNLDYLAKWDNLGGDNLGSSVVFDNGANVGIGTNLPGVKLDVNGDLRVRGDEVITFNPGPNSYDVPVGDIYAPPPYVNPLNGQSLSLLRLRSDDEVWVFVDDDQNSNGGFVIFDDRDNGANDADANRDILFLVGEFEAPNFYGLVSLPWWTRMTIGDLSSGGNANAMLEIMPSAGTDYFALSTTNASADTGNILMVKNSGNVGINRNSPGQKLEVGGNISVVGGSFIDDGTTLNVPDYVFEPDYQLKPLEQLDQFIKENKHLPGLPDMNDIEAWADLSMQDRDMKLLEKIEELTLYIIELEKRVSELEAQIK